MLLQRLISDDKIGFNYDYMGSAEFEFTDGQLNTRAILASAWREGSIKAVKTTLKTQHGDVIPMIVFGTADDLAKIGAEYFVTLQKSTLRASSERIRGWLTVDAPVHLVFVRDGDREAMKALELFLKPFVEEANAISRIASRLAQTV